MDGARDVVSRIRTYADSCFHAADTDDQRAVVENLSHLQRLAGEYAQALSTENDQLVRANEALRDENSELLIRVQELEAELVQERSAMDLVGDAVAKACGAVAVYRTEQIEPWIGKAIS